MAFNDDGSQIFLVVGGSAIYIYDLVIPYDFSTGELSHITYLDPLNSLMSF